MDPKDWDFVAEGGKHVIFIYKPKGESREVWEGFLIRIRKESFQYGSASACRSDELENELTFMKDIIGRNLAPYVDVPKEIVLDWDFVQDLRRRVLMDVPLDCRRKWVSEQDCDPPPIEFAPRIRAFLIRDYRLIPPYPFSGTMRAISKAFSIEIKPKAGFTTISPLVAPERRVKYFKSRFALMQSLYRNGKVRKDWMKCRFFRVSQYDPLDLFSGDPLHIRRALLALACNPQNNFNVWVEQASLGTILNDGSQRWKWSSLPLPSFPGKNEDNRRELLMEAAASILSTEPFLSSLLRLQKLDLLDADGALLVYKRLHEVCLNMQEDEVDDLLDRDVPTKVTLEEHIHPLLQACPIKAPSGDSDINRLCKVIQDFSAPLAEFKATSANDAEVDNMREQASEIVSRLNRDDCVYFLQNWLLSLALCDVSFFVTLRLVDGDLAKSTNGIGCGHFEQPSRESKWCVVKKQTAESPGLIQYLVDQGQSQEYFKYEYSIRLIDFGQKPASKLRSRSNKEACFNDISI